MTDDKWRGEGRTETMRLYMRKKRAERKELGLCITCGSYPAVEGKTKCERCRERQREANRRMTRKKRT